MGEMRKTLAVLAVMLSGLGAANLGQAANFVAPAGVRTQAIDSLRHYVYWPSDQFLEELNRSGDGRDIYFYVNVQSNFPFEKFGYSAKNATDKIRKSIYDRFFAKIAPVSKLKFNSLEGREPLTKKQAISYDHLVKMSSFVNLMHDDDGYYLNIHFSYVYVIPDGPMDVDESDILIYETNVKNSSRYPDIYRCVNLSYCLENMDRFTGDSFISFFPRKIFGG